MSIMKYEAKIKVTIISGHYLKRKVDHKVEIRPSAHLQKAILHILWYMGIKLQHTYLAPGPSMADGWSKRNPNVSSVNDRAWHNNKCVGQSTWGISPNHYMHTWNWCVLIIKLKGFMSPFVSYGDIGNKTEPADNPVFLQTVQIDQIGAYHLAKFCQLGILVYDKPRCHTRRLNPDTYVTSQIPYVLCHQVCGEGQLNVFGMFIYVCMSICMSICCRL